jgi:hypothetical protein
VASYSVNESAVKHVRGLIEGKQYVLDSEWGEVQPSAEDENEFLESHSWQEYGDWHLGLTEGASEEPRRATGSSAGTSGGCTGAA